MMKRQYRVKGDFNLMLQWNAYFGGGAEEAAAENVSGQSAAGASAKAQPITNMNILLTPWIVFWVAAAIHPIYGSVISILACTVVNLWYLHNKKTFYDGLSGVLVSAFSAALLLGADTRTFLIQNKQLLDSSMFSCYT